MPKPLRPLMGLLLLAVAPPSVFAELPSPQLHRRETAQTFAKLEGLHQANQAFLSESQVMEEVKAYRHERRESRS